MSHNSNNAWKVVFACLVIFLLLGMFWPSTRQNTAVSSPSRVDDAPKREFGAEEKKNRESAELREIRDELKKLRTMIAKPAALQSVPLSKPQAKPQAAEQAVEKPSPEKEEADIPEKIDEKKFWEYEPKFPPAIEGAVKSALDLREQCFKRCLARGWRVNYFCWDKEDLKNLSQPDKDEALTYFVVVNQAKYEEAIRLDLGVILANAKNQSRQEVAILAIKKMQQSWKK